MRVSSTPLTISSAPTTVFQPSDSFRKNTPTIAAHNGVRYATVEATVEPTARITDRFHMYASPVPTAPSTTMAAIGPFPPQCGAPLNSGATSASSRVAQLT
ncbi:hypothetical protein SMICM17S_13217 [Streptomyces microflavus]